MEKKYSNRKISIVIPVYNEEESIPELYTEIGNGLNKCFSNMQASDYEIWFVNDGSTDNSENQIKKLINKDNKVHLISFFQNKGQSKAMNTGFHHVSGDIVFYMDADLQDNPAEFIKFIDKLDQGYGLVIGWRNIRKDKLEKRLASKLYNHISSLGFNDKLHDHNSSLKCFKAEAIKNLELEDGFHRFIPALVSMNGFKVTEIEVEHRKRKYGVSKYNVKRYFEGARDYFKIKKMLKRGRDTNSKSKIEDESYIKEII